MSHLREIFNEAIEKIFEDLLEERQYAIRHYHNKDGSKELDQTYEHWSNLIENYARDLSKLECDDHEPERDYERQRFRLMKVAQLSISAIWSLDAQNGKLDLKEKISKYLTQGV